MAEKKDIAIVSKGAREPFAMLKEMGEEFDRLFDESFWPSFNFRRLTAPPSTAWLPKVDVFEKDNRLVTRVDLPGMKKEDVSVEVTDGHLAIKGERKRETEENKQDYFRSEREYGSFYRVVPLPDGAKLEDVKATFADGVLEVSLLLPAQPAAKIRKIEIQEAGKTAKTAA